jgi:hypothetical protein
MQAYSFITADTLISTARSEAIGSTTSSLAALQDTMMLAKVQQINAEFVNAAHTKHPLGGWSWMRTVTNFQTKSHTNLNGAVAAGDASFVLTSGADWDSTGRSVIETAKGALDFVDHSSKATHTMTVSTATGAETLSMAHATGERVEKLPPLPSDYSKARVLYVNSTIYDYERLDQFPDSGHFTTYGPYILMPRGLGAQDCTLYYEKKGNTISGLTSETNIPSELSQYAVEKLKAYIYLVRRKRGDVQTALALAEDGLQYAFSMDSQQTSNSEFTRIPLPY